MALITLTTDFGQKDGHPGEMKGVILGIAPGTQIVDISHDIQPQNIAEGALILARSTPYFPDNTIHIAVVDPGVGTARRAMAGKIGSFYIVGPDNGLFSLLLTHAEQTGKSYSLVHLNQPRYWLPNITHIFQGRDIFAPVGAHIAKGVPLSKLGTPLVDPVRITMPRPTQTRTGFTAEIIHVDHFGNLVTSVRRDDVPAGAQVAVRVAGRLVDQFVDTFGDRPPGELVCLFGQTESLIVSQVNGSAAQVLGAGAGDQVEVLISN